LRKFVAADGPTEDTPRATGLPVWEKRTARKIEFADARQMAEAAMRRPATTGAALRRLEWPNRMGHTGSNRRSLVLEQNNILEKTVN
jgi:hypothetical protein